MRSRWITLLGRGGSILLVLGLVLALVYTIPSVPSGTMSSSGANLRPGGCHVGPHTRVYSPKKGLRIELTANNTLQLYLIATHYEEVIELHGMCDVSVLKAFLQRQPEDVLRNETVHRVFSLDFFPSKLTNITAVLSNPSQAWIDADLKISGRTTLVSRERAVAPAQILIASGAVLVIPLVVMGIRMRRRE